MLGGVDLLTRAACFGAKYADANLNQVSSQDMKLWPKAFSFAVEPSGRTVRYHILDDYLFIYYYYY